MELTIITLDESPGILPCFEEDDACLNLPNTSLLLCYNPAQVLKMGGKHYLTGPVILVRTNMDGEVISLTIDEVYLFQKYLASHSITLMADDQKLPCICMDRLRCAMLNFFIGFAFFEAGAFFGFFVAALLNAAHAGQERSLSNSRRTIMEQNENTLSVLKIAPGQYPQQVEIDPDLKIFAAGSRRQHRCQLSVQ